MMFAPHLEGSASSNSALRCWFALQARPPTFNSAAVLHWRGAFRRAPPAVAAVRRAHFKLATERLLPAERRFAEGFTLSTSAGDGEAERAIPVVPVRFAWAFCADGARACDVWQCYVAPPRAPGQHAARGVVVLAAPSAWGRLELVHITWPHAGVPPTSLGMAALIVELRIKMPNAPAFHAAPARLKFEGDDLGQSDGRGELWSSGPHTATLVVPLAPL